MVVLEIAVSYSHRQVSWKRGFRRGMLPWGWEWVTRRRTSPGCGVAGEQAWGGPQAPAAHTGDVPLGGGPVLGLLGALGLELVALQRGWELRTTTGARPNPAHPGVLAGTGECPLLAAGASKQAGALEVAPADVPSVHLPQSYF